MDETRKRTEPSPELWKSVPLEFALSAAAIFLASALKLAGAMP